MKIRDKLMLSYLFIILLFMSISFFYTYTIPGEITERSSQTTEEAAKNIIDKNISLSEAVLTSYAERIVALRAEDVADDLSLMLGKADKSIIKDVARNEEARKIVLQNIRTYNGEVAGYIDLYDNKGNSIIHPNPDVEGKNYKEWADEYPGMWKLVQESFSTPVVKGYYDFIDEKNNKIKKFMVLIQVKDTPLIVSASVNINTYFLPVQNQIRDTINDTVGEVKRVTNIIEDKTIEKLRNAAIAGGALLLLIGFIISLLLSNSISRPVGILRDGVKQLGKGDFKTTVPEDGSQEIVELSHSFNELGKELTSYIEQLKKETSTRQALESEIKIARRIQSTMLPDKFPVNDKFEIFAQLEPAKEVSGDFFDIFFLKEDTLAIIIGDVSGKGIPASIFMALTAAALKSTCKRITHSPALALKETNHFLQDYEEACMFITVFLGYYNINTGQLLYGNAGHNKTILLDDRGKSSLFGSFGDAALGALPDYDYKEESYQMKIDETVVLYTDGITEAVSSGNEEFGIERLCSLMEANSSSPIKDISETTIKTLSDFQGENQFDDITFLILRRK